MPGELLTHKPVRVRPLEEVWAEEGIEALAGKGWQDLEAEQTAREDLEIRARVRAVLTQPFVSLQPLECAALLLVNGTLWTTSAIDLYSSCRLHFKQTQQGRWHVMRGPQAVHHCPGLPQGLYPPFQVLTYWTLCGIRCRQLRLAADLTDT